MSCVISRRRRRPTKKPPDLRKFIAEKLVSRLTNRLVCLLGADGTGRRTVMERFLNMCSGSLEDQEIKDRKTRGILVDLERRTHINRREIINLLVMAFNLEELDFSTMFHVFPEVSACAVMFDVTEHPTLYTAVYCTVKLRWLLRCPPRFILVGHMIDKPGRVIMPARGQIACQMTGAERYYECSALVNMDMDPVLDALLIMALGEPLPLPP